MEEYKILKLSGMQILEYIPDLANMRINVFHEFPYLYEGDKAYEEKYLQSYAECSESFMIVVLHKGKVIGCSTAMPLEYQDASIIEPFKKLNYPIEKIFYYAESIILPEHRYKGLGRVFFQEQEAFARSLKRFSLLTFIAIERPVHHPLRPKNYVPLNAHWNRLGFYKNDLLKALVSYKEIGEKEQSPKEMAVWTKDL